MWGPHSLLFLSTSLASKHCIRFPHICSWLLHLPCLLGQPVGLWWLLSEERALDSEGVASLESLGTARCHSSRSLLREAFQSCVELWFIKSDEFYISATCHRSPTLTEPCQSWAAVTLKWSQIFFFKWVGVIPVWCNKLYGSAWFALLWAGSTHDGTYLAMCVYQGGGAGVSGSGGGNINFL